MLGSPWVFQMKKKIFEDCFFCKLFAFKWQMAKCCKKFPAITKLFWITWERRSRIDYRESLNLDKMIITYNIIFSTNFTILLKEKSLVIKRLRGYPVLGAGLEPARPKGHRILSPACLPIPPSERTLNPKKKPPKCWKVLSGRRDSNSRPQPWQGCALPTELLSLVFIISNSLSTFGKVVLYSRKIETCFFIFRGFS